MQMESSLIVGCNSCENKLVQTKGYILNANGSYALPFSTQVSYSESDLSDLLLNHYTCPFCNQTLEIKTNMIIYAQHFLKRPFHIELHQYCAEISNGELNFFIPYGDKIDSLSDYLCGRGLHLIDADNYLPTDDEVHQIQDIAKRFDPSEWTFRIESGLASEPYLSTKGLWFNGINDFD